jgi:hypothetical protein
MLQRRMADRWLLAAFPALVFAFLIPFHAFAATLYLSPAAKTVAVGQTFTATIEVSSADQAMNAVSVDLSFPSDKLRVLSVSQTDSIVNFWVQSPTFSNAQSTGDVVLQGVVLSPGFLGAAGNVVNVVFQAIAPGNAPVSFSSGSVLANDGKGTNILAGMSGAEFTIGEAPAPVAAPKSSPSASKVIPVTAPPAALTSGIAITSVPSVEEGKWYSFGNIQFNWNMPIGADGIWYALASSSTETPSVATVASQATSASYDLSSLDDGTWYFLISSETNGIWSPVVAKQFGLDRKPPDPFTITRTDSDPADTQLTFTWTTTDSLSGLSHYEVKIGDGDWFDPEGLRQGSSYLIPESTPGKRSLAVRAIDNAGNIQEEDTTFTVVAPNSWQEWWYQVMRFLSFSLVILAFIIVAFLLLYYLLVRNLRAWKRKTTRELREFEKELHEELGTIDDEIKKEKTLNIDLRPSNLEKEKRSIEKETTRIKEETEAKLEDIEKLTGDK